MEQSDLLIVTKADGELEKKARLTQTEYVSALKYMRPRAEEWRPEVSHWRVLFRFLAFCKRTIKGLDERKVMCLIRLTGSITERFFN